MKILYIEDDEIDVLAMKRLLRDFEGIDLTVRNAVKDLDGLDYNDFDMIISDSNLPDGTYSELKDILPPEKTQFISGSDIDDFDVWLKPISKLQLETILYKETTIDMTYIKNLADGDASYEQEMIDLAKKVLPQRGEELHASKGNMQALKVAAHKTKSSYRVCGMNNSILTKLENLSSSEFSDISLKERLLQSVKIQIDAAVEELNKKSLK